MNEHKNVRQIVELRHQHNFGQNRTIELQKDREDKKRKERKKHLFQTLVDFYDKIAQTNSFSFSKKLIDKAPVYLKVMN